MKFFILLLSVGFVLAQEETTTESSATEVSTEANSTEAVTPTTESTETVTEEFVTRQVCDGRGKLVTRVGCLETCSRAIKIGQLPIFTVIREGEPCKTNLINRRNNGICKKLTRFGVTIPVCRAN